MDPEVDADVLLRSVREPAVFGVVYERHGQTVARYVARRIGEEALAEDLTAEVFARAFSGRTGYRPLHPTALPWLFGIASNVIAGHRRSERRRLAALERLARSTPPSTPQDVAADMAPELVHALRRLSSADRDTLLLVVWGEISYEEAATALGVPIGTVRSRIARARQQLSTTASTHPRSMRRRGPRVEGDSHA